MTLQERIGKTCPECGHDGARHWIAASAEVDIPERVGHHIDITHAEGLPDDEASPVPMCLVGHWLDEDGLTPGPQVGIAGDGEDEAVTPLRTFFAYFCGPCILLALVDYAYGTDGDSDDQEADAP